MHGAWLLYKITNGMSIKVKLRWARILDNCQHISVVEFAICPVLVLYNLEWEHTFFSLKKDSRTRGHEVKLVKDQCRLDIRKHSFSQRTINEWNKLSTDCVTASSVNMFKNKVDTYLRRAGYK